MERKLAQKKSRSGVAGFCSALGGVIVAGVSVITFNPALEAAAAD
jgi:hypothetical protein